MLRYESYKPSGIPWVGDIPSHWEIKKNKFLLSERKAVVGKDAPKFKLLSLTLQGVILRDMENPKGKFPAEFDTYKQVSPDDLIFCLFDVEETPRTVGLAKHHGMITGAYTITRCNEQVSSAFLYYYYLSLDEGKQLRSLYTGLRNVITRDTFLSLATPFPPRKEQDRIVAFLDQKTAEIDAAIAKKERLIELLSAQKKILVQRAVTRGVSDGVPMRNSGVSWIGEIPAHWATKRVRAAFKNLDSRRIPLSGEQRGKMTSRHYDYYGASGAIDKVDDYIFDEPLILIAEDGANLVMRNLRLAFIASGKYWVNNHAHILKPFAGNMTYLCEALECVDYNPLITGAAQPKLTKDALKGVEIPFPPLEEQSAIASFISDAEMKYKEIESRFRGEMTLLANLKQATIANVVTGKIKV